MNVRSPLPPWYILGPILTVAAMLIGRALLAGDDAADNETGLAISSMTDLADWFYIQQDTFIPILPPGSGSFLQSGDPNALPFDPAGLPTELRMNMPGTVENDCPVYRVYLNEDPDSRAMVIYNDQGTEIYSFPAPTSYNPFSYVEANHPDLYSGDYSAEERNRLLAMYDPSRLEIALDLIPDEFYGNYYAAESMAMAPMASMALFGGGGMAMMGGGSSSELWVSAEGPADGLSDEVVVTVHLPTGFTNKVDIFSFDSDWAPYEGTDSVWLAVATGLQPASGTNIVVWTNSPLGDVDYQFYAAGSDYDEDGDGLSSAMEIMTYNSSATNIDSDADGLVDGFDGLISTSVYTNGIDLDEDGYVDGEVGNGTDPTNDDTTAPTVTIAWPADGHELVWIP